MCVLSAREAAKKYKGWRISDRMRERERGSKNMKEKKFRCTFHIYSYSTLSRAWQSSFMLMSS